MTYYNPFNAKDLQDLHYFCSTYPDFTLDVNQEGNVIRYSENDELFVKMLFEINDFHFSIEFKQEVPSSFIVARDITSFLLERLTESLSEEPLYPNGEPSNLEELATLIAHTTKTEIGVRNHKIYGNSLHLFSEREPNEPNKLRYAIYAYGLVTLDNPSISLYYVLNYIVNQLNDRIEEYS